MNQLETVKEISQQDKELFKKVYKKHTSEILPKYDFPRGKDHVIVDEFNNILNFCSEDYSLVDNKKVLLPIEEKLKATNIDFHRQVSISDGAEFRVSYLLKSAKKKVLGDLYPKLEIINSYNGHVKFRYQFGFVRLVCLNGLTSKHGTTKIQISKHSSDLNQSSLMFLLLDIMSDTNTFIEESKKDVDYFERLNSKKVTAKLIGEVTKQLKLSDKIANSATERFKFETGESKEAFTYVDLDGNLRTSEPADKSLFTLYNAINYAIYNNNEKEPMELKARKDVLLLEAVEARLN